VFRWPLLPWTSSKYYILWVRVYGLSYPECNAHTPYYTDASDLSGCTCYLKLLNFFSKVTEQKTCVLIFFTTFVWKFLILGIIQRDTIINVRKSSCIVPVILVRLHNLTRISRQIFKWYSNFMQLRLVGTELFHADGWADRQTDMKSLIITFCNYANTPQRQHVSP